MALSLFLSVLAVLCVEQVSGRNRIVFEAADDQLQVYYTGRQDVAEAGKVHEQRPDHEAFLGTVLPHNALAAAFNDFDSFVVRVDNSKTRVKVIAHVNKDADTFHDYPRAIQIRNIMLEGTPVELKHSPEDFIWIEPGHIVSHLTHGGVFELRDSDRTPFVSVRLDGSDEL
eukprot:TRINITY_DN43125_c0_g1_i1.p1 TRINITY_DN43125_c0_g1~~TRINITY_DN43125_c0_g1_i1.p1  ORF type:complete len:171 (+),score=26.81 TRINITY_DN43125_c0_g1_i1:83-595(+)